MLNLIVGHAEQNVFDYRLVIEVLVLGEQLIDAGSVVPLA